MARPEEPAEPVLAYSGNDVQVQVSNALADPVVHCNERSFRLHRRRNGPRE